MDVLERMNQLITQFAKKRIKIAIAESCTGGYVCHMVTNISGASEVFERGIISYSNEAKIDLLKVNPILIKEEGSVSKQVAEQMAEGVRNISRRCEIGIGITGIAGPTGGTTKKPVGLVYIGFSSENRNFVSKFRFKTDRINFKKEVLLKVLEFLEDYIK